jgi:hypothetical protein
MIPRRKILSGGGPGPTASANSAPPGATPAWKAERAMTLELAVRYALQ